MSAKTRHNGLSADDRSDIRSTILQARKTLEEEFERQLERYGIYDDERAPVSSLSHLSVEDIATRKEIDAALERELEATDGLYGRAYQNYVREATKEYLNRLIGLKTIEARELVTETLRTQAEYGNRSYMHYTVDEIAGELTDTSDDGLGVALDLAYQEIGSEIQVLFDGSDYTTLEPDFAVRREILDGLDDLSDDIWASDEAMGWVYQYFGENEREEIDERIDDENYKVQDTDVATKTQLFTPRYIVEWMVDNSLGRLWLEMHGDRTNIDDEDKCFYLAPLEESLIDRNVKDVREIKVLDPACGSGHMLFYAFDVLYEMYLEHSDVAEKYIPREILKNNLYGIDIDEGATQIAALALYVKAKSHAPDVAIEGMNIVSANAVLVNGEKKQEVLERADSELERRVLEQVWTSFEHIREWGSLVRIEEQIEEIIEEELEEVKATGQTQFTSDGLAKQSSVMSYSGEEESWEQVKERLLEQVTELAEEALEQNDPVDEMFAGEVEKSVQILDLLIHEYDVVISNPPYLGSAKMDSNLKNYIKSNYMGSRDLYTAFIERCTELVGENNYAVLVNPQGFMYSYSFRKLRSRILESKQIVEATHATSMMLGSDETIMHLLRNSSKKFTHSKFIDCRDAQERETKLREVTSEIRKENKNENLYIVDQNSFLDIQRSPVVYWFGNEILDLFVDDIERVPEPKKGLSTGNDSLFLRNWWEVPRDQIGDEYQWFMTSGNEGRYYYSSEKTVLWENDGKEIKTASGSHTRGESFYKEPGITCRKFGSLFTARIHQPDHIFAESAYFIPDDEGYGSIQLTGYLCSSLIRYIMSALNPAMHFNTSAIKTLPLPSDIANDPEIATLVNEAVEIQKRRYSLEESKREFQYNSENVSRKLLNYQYHVDQHNAEIEIIHGFIDTIVFGKIGISEDLQSRIHSKLSENLSNYPSLVRPNGLSDTITENMDIVDLTEKEQTELVESIATTEENSIDQIAEELGISPLTVATLRYEHGLYDSDEKREAAGRLLSYYLGILFGRWDNLEDQITPTEDGILVFDNQFDVNVTDRIRECIKATFDDVYEKEAEIEDLLNKDMTDWLRENFFRYHHTKEYRRRGQRIPIYWHLESDDGAFSCFLYYHAMDAETLPKLRGQYVDAKIDTLENRLESIESQLEGASNDRKPELNSELEEVQEQLDDVRDFGERLDELIDDGCEPDFEAGIWENIQKVDEYDLLQTELDKL